MNTVKKSDVKYRYALNENDELVEIQRAHIIGGTYHCPQCGKLMICKCGSKNAWHFAHNKAECDYNKYLHTVAEQRFLEWFNTSEDISLVLRTKGICNNANECRFYREYLCEKQINSDKFNLKQFFIHCEKEKAYEKNGHRYIADLLCRPKNDKNEPLFIEICVSHPCEQQKLDSGIRIIEFIIKSEDDIDEIEKNIIKESEKIRLYNFHPKEIKSSPNQFEGMLRKFIVFKSKKGYEGTINCNKLSNRRGLIELSIPYNGYNQEFLDDGGFFSIAFAVATKYDTALKHCCLCKYHIYDLWDGSGICKLYKKYGTNRYSSENDAQKCSYFQPDEDSIQKRIKKFDDYSKENPVDIWIKPE